jgi:acyl-CoA thioesterase
VPSEPPDDPFAESLGIEVLRLGSGHTRASLTSAANHANPHGTVHGVVLYAVAGAAIAAAGNDAERSWMISTLSVDYLRPAQVGDRLSAEVQRDEQTTREDLYVARITAEGADGPVLVALARARGPRRERA